MKRRLAFLLAAGLLCGAAPLQAQIQCWGEGCGRPFTLPILLPDGTAALPAAGFASEAGLGLSRPGAQTVGISAGSAQRVQVNTTALSLINVLANFTDAAGANPVQLARGGTNGALRIAGGTAPTGTGCGTGAAYSGNNTNGAVTIGTTPGTCVITFNGTWTAAPHCTLSNERAAGAGGHRATGITTTQFTITGTLAATDVISWACWGP